jgi:ubiquinone/menaquinone biosynthesis C-methylase UbiE
MSAERRGRFQLPEMEGRAARWYARNRGSASQMETCRRDAARLTAGLEPAAAVLEVAPGPGYLAVEMARSGRLRVTGLDISHTMVEIATEHARKSGIEVEFRRGDVCALPFATGSFDLVVCQAAFKNFRRPLDALGEMHRVLRAGGRAVIEDMNRDATKADVAAEVRAMKLSPVSGLMTRLILSTTLRRRAYSPARFQRLVARSPFHACRVDTAGMGLEVSLTKEQEA